MWSSSATTFHAAIKFENKTVKKRWGNLTRIIKYDNLYIIITSSRRTIILTNFNFALKTFVRDLEIHLEICVSTNGMIFVEKWENAYYLIQVHVQFLKKLRNNF